MLATAMRSVKSEIKLQSPLIPTPFGPDEGRTTGVQHPLVNVAVVVHVVPEDGRSLYGEHPETKPGEDRSATDLDVTKL